MWPQESREEAMRQHPSERMRIVQEWFDKEDLPEVAP
jgi:hypothetical protein